MAIRTNLMTNPSFEADLAGATPSYGTSGAGTLTRVTSGGYAGSAFARMTWTTASTAVSGYLQMAVAGTAPSGTANAFVWAKVNSPQRLQLNFTGSAAGVVSPAVDVPANTWTKIGSTAGVGGSGYTIFVTAAAGGSGRNWAVGDTLDIDAVMFEVGTSGEFFDGSFTAAGKTYAWTGAANSSASLEASDGARINLVTNPSFEVDSATGWATAPTRVAAAGAAAVAGTCAAYQAPTLNVQTVKYPAKPGVDYTASVWTTKNTTAVRSSAVSLHFFDAGGTELSAPTVTGTDIVAQNVPERRSSTRTAPTGTVSMSVWWHNTSTSGASSTLFDAVLLEQSPTLGDYFDGAAAKSGYTYGWTGTANASLSTETPPASTAKTIASALSGTGTLTSSLAYIKRINSALSGSGTLTAQLRRNISSNLSGSGTLTSVLAGRSIHSDFSGSGTLASVLKRNINSVLSGSATLTSSLAFAKRIDSTLSGEATLSSTLATSTPNQINSRFYAYGALTSVLAYRTQIDSRLGGEAILYSELGYVARPVEVGQTPLGKLASFSINTAAVPLNPAEGSGSAPSINAAYTRGTDPEYALGERNVLKNGAIGTYEGEVVKVGTSVASGRASISMDTALTPLNTELHLFPFIDGVPGLLTAGRAIDYWSQACGLFYDKVPGQCIAYASGFGHTDAYGAGVTGRFYEKLAGGATDTQVVNGRSVKTLGSAVTGTTALHEVKDGAVPVSLPKNRKLVFSIGLGLNGSGRMATVEWSFLDARDTRHTVSLAATSDGGVTASIGPTVVASASVPAGGTYRLVFSLERLSSTALAAKLSVLTDDLAGSGDLAYAGKATVVSMSLPGALRLTSITHASAGGAGAEMTRWGTYLTVADQHPAELPAVQKVLAATKKPFGFVSGFTGNVWNLLNEFCSIARLALRFTDGALRVGPRTNTISHPGVPWARFETDRSRREKYKQVAVVNKRSKAVTTDDALLWRADSVFQVAAAEVFETTVQTEHSILNLVQPVAVDGIMPFPYKQGGGQYVVTGADGYIVAPAWWNDNGGKVEVSLTGKEGEIAIKITAPTLETVRAPYRISEGAADRPALYVCGSGIVNDPKEVHVATGAKNAREGFDNVFESPFLAGVRETYDTAAAMAHQYSASVAEVQYELPNGFDTPTGLGQFPAGALVTDNLRNYRIQDANQTHSKVSGNAVPHTTIGAYVASYPAGATIRDEKARNAGRTIRKFNIKPLKGDA